MEYRDIGLIVGPEVGNEHEAIRQVLEYYGYRVIVNYIGRPKDFVNLINGRNQLMNQLDIWVFSFHGEDGAFVMPELGKDVYFENEPRKNFGIELLKKYGNFQKRLILSTACTMGQQSVGEVFLNLNTQKYIAPKDYIDGNAGLLFISHFFYELKKGKNVQQACLLAQKTDEETALFVLYE